MNTEMPSGSVVAAFDFDGTLTRRDTLGPFLAYSLGRWRYLWLLVRCSPWLIAYVFGLINNHLAKAKLLHLAMAGKSRQLVQRWAQSFIQERLPALLNDWGLKQLRHHQQLGHVCIIVSASPGFYLHEAGRFLSIDTVLCTEMEVDSTTYSGRMSTPNCHGPEKVARLRQWLLARYPDGFSPPIHAYGDSKGDLPMLEFASRAWYREHPWPFS